MKEQIKKIKLGENKNKDPSKASAAAPKSLYSSLVLGATVPVLPLYPAPLVMPDTPPGGAGLKEGQDPGRDERTEGSVLVVEGYVNVCVLVNLQSNCVCVCFH